MRISIFLVFVTLLVGIALALSLSGLWLFLSLFFLLFFTIISVCYSDTALLFILGAREFRGGDGEAFHTAAAQEAYKLAVPRPILYFYNGAIDRSFVLQTGNKISLVVSKNILSSCSAEELAAISFELLLQVKKGMAHKRTKVMFIVGFFSRFAHSLAGLLMSIIPSKNLRMSINWVLNYLFYPWIDVFFKMTLGDKYFRKLKFLLKDYPLENHLLQQVAMKLRQPREVGSLTGRKWIELVTVNKNRHYQDILVLEFLPHEWDVLFTPRMESRA
jgi:hypothetical protein